jgi:hypothetical protein
MAPLTSYHLEALDLFTFRIGKYPPIVDKLIVSITNYSVATIHNKGCKSKTDNNRANYSHYVTMKIGMPNLDISYHRYNKQRLTGKHSAIDPTSIVTAQAS